MELKELVGNHILTGYERGIDYDYKVGWFGTSSPANYIQFRLDEITYRIYEDPEDGYRSCCTDLQVVNVDVCKLVFEPVYVKCNYITSSEENLWREQMDVLSMIDLKSGKEIMRVGTANTGDYYPYIVNEWYPENLYINNPISLCVSYKKEKLIEILNDIRDKLDIIDDDYIEELADALIERGLKLEDE